jgi:hypothetical protein
MRWIGLAVIAVVAGCVSVEATRIRKDLYVVSVRGNAIGGQGEAVAAANERANQLCPDGYEIQDSAAGSTSAYLRTSYGYQQIQKPEVTIVVRCDRPEPAPPPPTPQPPAQRLPPTAPAAVARWWCYTQNGGQVGMCDRNPVQCETWRATSVPLYRDTSPCEPRALAYCFGVSFVGQVGSTDMCVPTPEACINQRNFTLGHPEQESALTACRAID